MYNVCILCKGVFMHLPLLDCFPDSTLILAHLLVVHQVCKNISNKNNYFFVIVYKMQGYTSVIITCADQLMSRAHELMK